MTIQTTYTQARDGLAKLLDQVTHNREIGDYLAPGRRRSGHDRGFRAGKPDGDSLSAALTGECGASAFCTWAGIEK